MKRIVQPTALLLALLLAAALAGCDSAPPPGHTGAIEVPQQRDKLYLDFAGGPTGGTFNFFANKIATIATHAHDYLDLALKGSGGSADNLRAIHHGSVDLGIVYAGDAWLGRTGRLLGDDTVYDKVRGLAFLYGAPAQLVVRAESDITSARQLTGGVVAVGNPGSGAALSAERFFSHLGTWQDMDTRNLGYSQAAADFADGKIDAFWVLAGFPNSSIVEAATRVPARLIDLDEDARSSGLYDDMPFYTPRTIPAGTYEGQRRDVRTFQDAAMLCAGMGVSAAAAQDILSAVFSPSGLEEMRLAHTAASDMAAPEGIANISIPLHPGALRFWEEQGLTIPASLR